MNSINRLRMKKEIEMFAKSPPPGIVCAPENDEYNSLTAQIMGSPGTPFEGGIFELHIQIPERYPFDPPQIRFVTPIYHPNIDSSGRICMDTLKLPPKGTWRPCLNISTVLMMIRVLMGEPGTEDPLMTDIWQEFKYEYETYARKAQQWTRQHALQSDTMECTDMEGQTHKRKACTGMEGDHINGQSSLSISASSCTERGNLLQRKRPTLLSDVSNKKMKL